MTPVTAFMLIIGALGLLKWVIEAIWHSSCNTDSNYFMKTGTQVDLFKELYEAQHREDNTLRVLRRLGFSLNYVYGAIYFNIDRTNRVALLEEALHYTKMAGETLSDVAKANFPTNHDTSKIGKLEILGHPVETPSLLGVIDILKKMEVDVAKSPQLIPGIEVYLKDINLIIERL